ncbi:hypothetical protein E2562_035569 [Oryza meyeriana var. granulata]|uniref:Uncharacterized protein n=1 Tax=Oryza meyeriana var. granulata TaxID=110450 RepID=A0A6G1ESQ6_9ORYZ|nr:hypothetical protein E2562_035569 [Oryza meyeriana var. granulata]
MPTGTGFANNTSPSSSPSSSTVDATQGKVSAGFGPPVDCKGGANEKRTPSHYTHSPREPRKRIAAAVGRSIGPAINGCSRPSGGYLGFARGRRPSTSVARNGLSGT